MGCVGSKGNVRPDFLPIAQLATNGNTLNGPRSKGSGSESPVSLRSVTVDGVRRPSHLHVKPDADNSIPAVVVTDFETDVNGHVLKRRKSGPSRSLEVACMEYQETRYSLAINAVALDRRASDRGPKRNLSIFSRKRSKTSGRSGSNEQDFLYVSRDATVDPTGENVLLTGLMKYIDTEIRKARQNMSSVTVADGKLYIDYKYCGPVPPGIIVNV